MTKSVEDFISSNNTLKSIFNKVQYLSRLKEKLNLLLGAEMMRHFEVGNYKDDILGFVTQSPTWAAYLRHHSSEILKVLKSHPEFRSLTSVYCKIQPTTASAPATLPKMPQRTIPPEITQHIAKVAQCIGDEKLRTSLKRLAIQSIEN